MLWLVILDCYPLLSLLVFTLGSERCQHDLAISVPPPPPPPPAATLTTGLVNTELVVCPLCPLCSCYQYCHHYHYESPPRWGETTQDTIGQDRTEDWVILDNKLGSSVWWCCDDTGLECYSQTFYWEQSHKYSSLASLRQIGRLDLTTSKVLEL